MGRHRSDIEVLGLVAKVGSQAVYAGWSAEGLPGYTTSASELSEKAKEDLRVFSRSGAYTPKIPMRSSHLSVAVVSLAGQVQDLKDQSPKHLVQDTIKIYVTDSEGGSQELTLGELEVLKMIADGMITFQRLGTIFDNVDRQEAVEMYSFFLPGIRDGEEGRPDMLLLVKPTNENLGNLIDAVVFVSDVIKKLISNDRRQPPGYEKGYLEAEDKAERQIQKQRAKEGGLFDFLYEPAGKEKSKSTLKSLLTDFLYVPADGSKPGSPFMVPVEKKDEFSRGSKENLELLRMIASKMYLYARSRIDNE